MKNMLMHTLYIILALPVAAWASGAGAPVSSDPSRVAYTEEAHKLALQHSRAQLAEAEGRLKSSDPAAAAQSAHQALLDLTQQIGLDAQKIELVSVGDSIATWPRNLPFTSLPLSAQDTIAASARARRYGLFSDLLYTLKSLRVVELEAQYQQSKERQGPRASEVEYFRRELLAIASLPIGFGRATFEGNDLRVAFDDEVLGGGLQFEFNARLLGLVTQASELGWTEESFAKSRDDYRSGVRNRLMPVQTQVLSTGVFRGAFKTAAPIERINLNTVRIVAPTYQGLPISVLGLLDTYTEYASLEKTTHTEKNKISSQLGDCGTYGTYDNNWPEPAIDVQVSSTQVRASYSYQTVICRAFGFSEPALIEGSATAFIPSTLSARSFEFKVDGLKTQSKTDPIDTVVTRDISYGTCLETEGERGSTVTRWQEENNLSAAVDSGFVAEIHCQEF